MVVKIKQDKCLALCMAIWKLLLIDSAKLENIDKEIQCESKLGKQSGWEASDFWFLPWFLFSWQNPPKIRRVAGFPLLSERAGLGAWINLQSLASDRPVIKESSGISSCVTLKSLSLSFLIGTIRTTVPIIWGSWEDYMLPVLEKGLIIFVLTPGTSTLLSPNQDHRRPWLFTTSQQTEWITWSSPPLSISRLTYLALQFFFLI